MENYATLPFTMTREIVLSSFFAVVFAVTATAQDAPQPIPAGTLVSPTPAPETAASATAGKKEETASKESTTEKAADTSESAPVAAAESVAMPVSSGTTDSSSLFSDPIKLEPLPSGESSGPEPTSSEEKAFKVSKNAVLKDDIKVRVRYRQVRTVAASNPKIQHEYETATTANTDPERREAWKAYYTMLFDKVIAIDASLKDRAEKDRDAAIRRITQRRLRASGEESGDNTFSQ